MPFPWNVWVALLAVVNVIGGFYFIGTLEGQLALAAMVGAFMTMTVVYSAKGFVRLLGLGHLIFWPPLLGWFGWKFASVEPGTSFQVWLGAVIAVNGVSLVIDFVDVIRYARGETAPLP
ncbi:hypothetical protein GC163_24455 [bacterium]|nr:hypothetical protein [bacterium]